MTNHWPLNLKLLLNLKNHVTVVGLDMSLAPACFPLWDTCPALLTLKVLLNTTQIYQRLSAITRSVIFKVPVGHITKYLFGHLKLVMLKPRTQNVIFEKYQTIFFWRSRRGLEEEYSHKDWEVNGFNLGLAKLFFGHGNQIQEFENVSPSLHKLSLRIPQNGSHISLYKDGSVFEEHLGHICRVRRIL